MILLDTSVLKEFAAETRRELTQGVSARLDTVLLPGSAARLDFPVLVGKLERAIEQTSREAVVDRVTYLWFNRFVALRFMDACGYTPVGIVSPAEGVDPMQAPPQVVSDAFAGIIDTDIVGAEVAQQVSDVVSGVRRSQDQYSDVFALLLDVYAQHFQSWVPAMFPDADDISNLLLPANLLSADSVVRKVTQSMTPEMCQDVEVIGWLYQFYIAERKDEVFEGFKKGVKAGAEQIPAATQLFTPDWIVRYLVQNTVGRTWLLNRPGSALRQQMEYFVEPVGGLESVEGFVRIASPEELTVLDPAVGSGHMLTYAFDLLYEMYLEDGYAEADIPGLILGKNLVGLELDERAGALAAFALTMKARGRYRRFFRRAVQPSICVLEPVAFSGEELRELATGFDFTRDYGGADSAQPIVVDEARFDQFWNAFEHANVFGSLIRPDAEVLELMEDHWSQHALAGELPEGALDVQFNQSLKSRMETALRQARLLSQKYATVVANPPYMGRKNMSPLMTSWLKKNYPNTEADLMTAFMERAELIGKKSAYWGMIDLPSWMFLGSFKNYREHLLKDLQITTLAHLGRGIFGSDFGSVAFVIQNAEPFDGTAGIYRKLYDKHVEVRSVETIRQRFFSEVETQFEVKQTDLLKVPDQAIAYWLPSKILKIFNDQPSVSSVADVKQGIITGDNDRFIRYWYEVGISKVNRNSTNREIAKLSKAKWFPHSKGGDFNKWTGNNNLVVNWENDGYEIINLKNPLTGKQKSRPQNLNYIFREGISWGTLSSSAPSFRYSKIGTIANAKGSMLFPKNSNETFGLLGLLNSSTANYILSSIAPTVDFTEGSVSKIPVFPEIISNHKIAELVSSCLAISEEDLMQLETSPSFSKNSLIQLNNKRIKESIDMLRTHRVASINKLKNNEEEINNIISKFYFDDSQAIQNSVDNKLLTLTYNSEYHYGEGSDKRVVADLISYFVGVLFGRYSLDAPGPILANQGETLADYLTKVGTEAPTFIPDEDNVIPVLADDRFEDDIVAKFKTFLKKVFGEENLEANLAFIESALGKNIRRYFTDEFFKDHLKRYSKRPIYWMFSSTGNGKGSFKALVYMHRYTPATVSTVLNDYLRPYMDKLTANREHLQYTITHGEGAEVTKAQKEDDKLGRVLKELTDYQDNVLYPLALQNKHIDLDDGVAHNYPLLGKALISFK